MRLCVQHKPFQNHLNCIVRRDLFTTFQWILEFATKFLYPNAQKVFSAIPSTDGQKLLVDCEVFDFRSKATVRKREEVRLDQRALGRLSQELKGLKVRFHRPDGALRDYRVNGIGPQVHVAVEMGDGKKMSVGKYIHDEYKHDLKHPRGLTLQGSLTGFHIAFQVTSLASCLKLTP